MQSPENSALGLLPIYPDTGTSTLDQNMVTVAREAYEKWRGAKLNSLVVLTYDTGRSDAILKESRGCHVKM